MTMDELTKGLIEHLKKSDPTLEVVESPRFLPVEDFHPVSWEKPMSTERDTHFAKFAELSYPGLERLFADLFWCRMHGQYEKARITEMLIKEIIAHFAYDLVYHLLKKAPSGSFDVGFGTPEEIHEMIAYLPDMDAWPT